MHALVFVLLGLLGAGLSMLVWGEQVRLRADHLDQFTDDALQRGWRFTTTYSRRSRHRTDRWDGPSGAWTAESEGALDATSWDPRILRWWNAGRRAAAPSGPLVMLLDADGKTLPDVSKVESRLARFAARRRLAKAFARHFGEALALDGRDLQRVDGLGPLADGFAVLSDHPAEAARRLTPALLAAIRQAWSAWGDIGVTIPMVALSGGRIAIACVPQRPAQIAHVAALVEAGSVIASARG